MGATYDQLTLGMMAAPIVFNAQRNMQGNIAMLVYGGLNQVEPALGNHGFTIALIDNTGMFAGANSFANTPTFNAMPINLGNTCGGCLEAYGGMASPNPPSMANPPTQIYVADTMMGTVTISTFAATQTTNQYNVFGSFDNVKLNGYDANGNLLNPPCSTTVTKINFFFRPTFPAQTVARVSDLREGLVRVPVTVGNGL